MAVTVHRDEGWRQQSAPRPEDGYGDVMDAVGLFLGAMEDLRQRAKLGASEYDVVQASGVLRRLLLDSRSLWSLARGDLHVEPVYKWSKVYVNVRGRFIPMLWLDPVLFRARLQWAPFEGHESDEVSSKSFRAGNIDEFLKHMVAAAPSGNDRVTVRTLIKHYANKRGGVHLDPSSFEHDLLKDLEPEYDRELQLSLVAVGRVVHRALEPLAIVLSLLQESTPYGLDVALIEPETGSSIDG